MTQALAVSWESTGNMNDPSFHDTGSTLVLGSHGWNLGIPHRQDAELQLNHPVRALSGIHHDPRPVGAVAAGPVAGRTIYLKNSLK